MLIPTSAAACVAREALREVGPDLVDQELVERRVERVPARPRREIRRDAHRGGEHRPRRLAGPAPAAAPARTAIAGIGAPGASGSVRIFRGRPRGRLIGGALSLTQEREAPARARPSSSSSDRAGALGGLLARSSAEGGRARSPQLRALLRGAGALVRRGFFEEAGSVNDFCGNSAFARRWMLPGAEGSIFRPNSCFLGGGGVRPGGRPFSLAAAFAFSSRARSSSSSGGAGPSLSLRRLRCRRPWCSSALVLVGPGARRPWCSSALVLVGPGARRPWCSSALVLVGPGARRPWCSSALVLVGPGARRPWCSSALVLVGV